jgi:hypothetical protein
MIIIMSLSANFISALSQAWDVLIFFLIPVGGGIPAGVLLARTRGIAWPAMMVLYFISDVILACVFEPLMLFVIKVGSRSPFFVRFAEAMKMAMKKTTAVYGTSLGPLALIMVAFGTDPMTGRVATRAAGHGFVSGWLLTIAGDMIYFSVIMISTLWLNHLLGNGTWTMVIILAAMILIPILIKRLRKPLS